MKLTKGYDAGKFYFRKIRLPQVENKTLTWRVIPFDTLQYN